MKTLLIEGWRGINHSYSLVNQHQLLHFEEHPDLAVYHLDAPFSNDQWRKTTSGFDEDQSVAIDRYAPPASGKKIDVLYRMTFPFRLTGGAADRVFVFCTSELGRIPDDSISRVSDTPTDGAYTDDFEIITPSNWSLQGIKRSAYAERVHLVPHGIDPDQYWPATKDEKQSIRRQFNLPQKAFIFLNVGAMTWNKGIVQLITAFALHKKRYADSCLLLKGADFLYGDMFTRAFQEARRLDPTSVDNARDSIIYSTDNLSHESLAALYRASDAYVSPYLAEAFNLPVLEAIASGLPVVVTAGGPTDDFCRPEFALNIASDIVQSDKGIYLKPDLDDLVRQMSIVTENQRFRTAAAQCGPRWARQNYSWQAVTKTLVKVLSG